MFSRKSPGSFGRGGDRGRSRKDRQHDGRERRALRQIAPRSTYLESLEERVVLSHSPLDPDQQHVLAAGAPAAGNLITNYDYDITARYGDVTRIDLRELIENTWNESLEDDPLLGYYEFDIVLPFLTGSVATDGNGVSVANYLSDDNELFVDRGALYYIPQIITPSTNPGALAAGATSDVATYDVHFIDATDNSDEIVYSGDLNISIDLDPASGYSTIGEEAATFGTSRLEIYKLQQRLRYLGYQDAIGNAANLIATTGDLNPQTAHAAGVFNAAIADSSVNENTNAPNAAINSEAAPRWVQVTYGPGITNAGSNEDYMTHLAKAALLAADANTTHVLPFIGATTKGGGDTPGHSSHEAGMDIDIDTVGTNNGSTPFYKTNTIASAAYVAAKATGDAAANNHIAQIVGPNYVAKRFRGSVTGATNANPIVITSNGHGLANGEQVTVSGVLGNTAANGTFAVSNVTANTFRLVGAVGNGAYTSGGTWVMAAAPAGAVAHTVGANSGDPNATVNKQAVLTGIKDLIVDGTGYSLVTEQAKIDAFRTQGTTVAASVYFNDPRTWTSTGVPVKFSSGHGGHFHVNVQKPAVVSGDEQRGLMGGLGAFFQNILPDLTADDPSASASPPAGSPAGSPSAGNLNILGLADIPFVQENFGELIDIVQVFDDLQTRLVQKANVEGQGVASTAAISTTPFFVIFDGGNPHEVIIDAGTYANSAAWLNELNNDALASVPYLGLLDLGDFLVAKDDDNDGRIEFETANEGFTQSLTITTLRLTAGSAAAANGQLAADASFTLDIERETGTTPYVIEIQVDTPTEAEEEAAAPYNVPHTNDNYNLDTLLDDVNDALLLAGVYDVIAVKDPAGTRIALAATDPTITKITVNNIADDAALGFANGAAATEAYDPDTATPPSSPLGFAGIRDVPDLKYPTINDLVDNLATELAAISDGPLPGGFDVDSEYDEDEDILYFNVALNKEFTKTIDLNFDEGFDLGILGTLEIIADATADFNASVELSFRVGMYLGALGDDFVLDNTTLLADLNGGDGVPLDVGILAANAVPGPQGKVSPDVSFNVTINGGAPIGVLLDDAATTTNYDIAALASDLNAALGAIAATGYTDPAIVNLDDVVRFSVDTVTNKLALRGVHPEVYSVGIGNVSNLSDLGFTGAELPNRPDFVITIDPLGVPVNYNVDLDGATDIGDVITKIQAAAPVTVTINSDKGLSITSNTADEIDISATATSTALGIAGSSLGSDTIIGQSLHGESSVDRIFIVESDASENNLTIAASFETNGLNLSAGLGFLSFDVTATDELEIGANLAVRLTDPSSSPDGRITFEEILETTNISDLVDLDTPAFVVDGTLAVSSPMLLAIGDSSTIASLDISLTDPTDITSIDFDFTTNEDAFKGLKDLSIAEILDIVHNVVDLLLENNDIPWLNEPIPLVDASLSDALGFLDDLLDKIDEIASKIDPDELNEMLDTVETAIGDLNIPFIDKDPLFKALNMLRAVINEIDLGSFSESPAAGSPGGSPGGSPSSGNLDIGDINRLPGRLLAATANARKAIEAVPNSAPGKQALLDALDTFESLVPDLEKLEQRVEDAVSDALESVFPGLNVTTKLDFVDYNCNTATVENALIVGITLDGSDLVSLDFEPDLDVPDLGPVEIQLGADLTLRAGGVLNLGFGAKFDTSSFVPFVIAGPDQVSCGYTDHVQTELNLNAGFAGAASADVRFGQLDLLEGDIDMSLVKGNEDHVVVAGASGNRHVNLTAAPWNADPRLVIVQVGSETSPRPAEDFSISGTTLLFASNVQPALGTPVVVSYRTNAAPNVNVVGNRAALDVTFNQTPSDGNTLGAIPLGTFLSNFGSSLDLDVQGVLTGTVDVEFLNSTAEDAVTLAIGLEDPLDPQFHFDASAIEDMFANIDFDLTLICQGVESLLDTLEAGLTSEIASKLPLVGGALDTTGTFLGKLREDFVTPICDFLEDVGGSLEDVAAFVRQEVFDLLGPSGIDILGDRPEDANSSIGLTDVIVNLTTDNFEIIVTLAGSDETTVDFDTNVAGLPIEVQASGGVRVGWDYKIDLGIGIDRASGFYFVLNDEDDMNNSDGDYDDPEFEFNLDIGLAVDNSGSEPIPTSFGINLFGLELSATDILNDDGTRGTGVGGLLTLDVAVGGPDDPDGYRRLSVADIGDKPFHEMFTAKLDTMAEINLELAAEIDANLPSIRTDLMVSFGVEVSTGSSGVEVDFDTPTLQFKDIRLDLGDFLSKHIGKVLKDVDGFIDPIKPVVKLLLTEVPGLSQLSELAGRGKVTFLDLAFIKNPEQGETAKRFIGILDQIISLIDTLAGFGPGENVAINFGTITIDASSGFSFENNLWAENFSATDYLDDNPSFGASVVNDINTLNTAVASVFQKAEREPDPEGTDGLGISFDIIKPENIIKLLLGQRANIVTWDIPRFDVGLSLEMSFRPIPIIYPFKVTVGFDLGAFADLSVGYDTRGILETHNFFDGFFFGDRANVDSGEDIPELGLLIGARLRAELDLLVASAGIEGALVATIDANWRDVDNDGKMYLDEIAQLVKQDGLLCLFDITGELRAIIRLVWSIFGADDSKDIINVLIFKFMNECPKFEVAHVTEGSETLPDGTTVPAGTLVLHSGSLADQRQPGSSSDVAETFTLTQLGGGVVSIDGMGFTQRYGGVLQIYADGGDGNDRIELVDVDVDATIHGGDGDDTLISGTGADLVTGGAGKDIITTKNGADTIDAGTGNDLIDSGIDEDSIAAGGGNDTVDSGDGADTITGGDGNDSITSGQGADDIDAGSGNDYVDSGTESDTIVGGAGDDTIYSFAGADSITGDGGKDYIEGGAGGDTILGGAQNDTIYGQGANDSIDGGAGRDYLEGNDGNDTILGGSGHDTLLGQIGDDSMRGGFGHDSMVGDIGNDTMVGDADNDLLIGNDGVDDLYGGFGNDVIYSFIPGNTADPANAGHHVEGNPDDDFMCGTTAADDMWGGTHDDGYTFWTEWTDGGYPTVLSGGFTPVGCTSGGEVTFEDPGVATIKGAKFRDGDGDGIRGEDEPGLSGWTIQILDADGEIVDETETDSDGEYEFEDLDGGTYTLVEVMQDGWVQTSPAGGSHQVTVDGGQIVTGFDFGNFELASVSGFKWSDADKDGLHDEGEVGLAGVFLWADADDDGIWDAGVEQYTFSVADDPDTEEIDETGNYTISNLYPGDYIVREIVPAGYVRTYPVRNVLNLDRFESVTVSNDWSSDSPDHPGRLDIDRTPQNQRGFLGPFGDETVTLDLDNLPAHTLLNISFDLFVIGSWNGNAAGPNGPDRFQFRADGNTLLDTTFSNTSTNQAYPGAFAIGNFPAKAGAEESNSLGYGLTGIPASQPPANPADSVYRLTFSIPHVANTLSLGFEALLASIVGDFEQWGIDNVTVSFPIDGHSVSLGSGDAIEGLDFGNYAIPGEVHGTKFDDLNANGVRNVGEPGIGGVTVYLDLDNDGTFDTNEPWTKTSTGVQGDIDNDGFVGLNDLAIMQANFGSCNVTIAQGDLNSDGCVNASDAAILASFYGNSTSNPNFPKGLYSFTNLEPGQYVVREVVPMGYVQTAPASGSHVAAISPGTVLTQQNFGNTKGVEIHGTKWHDRNANGQRETTEPGLAGVTIYADLNNNGQLDAGEPSAVTMADDPTTTANETGAYWLKGIKSGSVVIREVVPDGCRQTSPSLGFYSLNVTASQPIQNANFGNVCEGEIHGTKWFDRDSDRQYDTDEPGVPNVTIYLDLNNNGQLDAGEPTTTTRKDIPTTPANEDGLYSFVRVPIGTYVVREVVPQGMTPTYPVAGGHAVTLTTGQVVAGRNFGNTSDGGEIHGTKWNDINRNGQRDANAAGVEPGVPGVTVYIDRDNDGVFDTNEPSTVTMIDNPATTMNEAGMYWFTNVPAGTWIIREVLPAGYTQTFPANSQGHTVRLDPRQVVKDRDFGNSQNQGGTVTGTKWDDANSDGRRDTAPTSENGVPGVTIFLDANNNGQLDAGEATTTTLADNPSTPADEAGTYVFTNVPPGTYTVLEVLPNGFTQTFPANNGGHTITVATGQTIGGRDFGNTRDRSGTVTGTKWDDLNGNGQRDTAVPQSNGPTIAEPGVAGVRIYSDVNGNGMFDAGEPNTLTMADIPTTPLDEAGRYILTGVQHGVHVIREDLPAGSVQTFPGTNGGHTINVPANQTVPGVNFGNYKTGEIHGTKWNDLDSDGRRNGTASGQEPGIAGVTIFIDVNGDGIFQTTEPSTTTMADNPATPTNEAGQYWFMGLAPGLYRIREVVPTGMTPTFPTAANPHDVTILSGDIVNDIDFGNHVDQTPIRFTSFSDAGNFIRTNGNAGITQGRLRLTNNGTNQRGSAYLSQKVQFTGDFTFSTHFTFEISLPGGTSDVDGVGGHGLTFVMHNAPAGIAALGTVGGGMGLSGITPAVAVEFDTFHTGAFDPASNSGTNGSHVGIDVSSVATSVAQTGALPRFNDGGVRHAWIDYDGFGNVMNVYMSTTSTKPAAPTLTFSINLTGPTDLFVGFTAATDAAFNRHEILAWEMSVGGVPLSPPADGEAPSEAFSFSFETSVPTPAAAPPASTILIASGSDWKYLDDGSNQGVAWRAPAFNDAAWPVGPAQFGYGEGDESTVIDTVGANGKIATHYFRKSFTISNIEQVNNACLGLLRDDGAVVYINGVELGRTNMPAGAINFQTAASGEAADDGQLYQMYPVNVGLLNQGANLIAVELHQSLVAADNDASFDAFLFAEPCGGNIHGFKWRDLDGDGQRDANEPGVAGVTIYADVNGNGQYDPAVDRDAVTKADSPATPNVDETGMYWIPNIPLGNYRVREVVPAGMTQTAPAGGFHTVFVETGFTVSNVDFGNRPNTNPQTGEVHGTKYFDLNWNRQQDVNEGGIAGVTIYADLNNNGALDTGEPSTQTMSDNPQTPNVNETGMYWLANLPPTTVVIREVVPQGFIQTAPLGGFHTVLLTPGAVVQGRDFGNTTQGESGEVFGTKWVDLDGDGKRGPLEPGLAGVTIYSDVNMNGQFDPGEPSTVTMADNPATQTNEAGRYELDLGPGQHLICEVIPVNMAQTFPTTNGGCWPLSVGPGTVAEGFDFGNQPSTIRRGEIHGMKWDDYDNALGSHDAYEPGVAGITIYLDLNNNGVLDPGEPNTVTNSSGNYSFTMLPAGTYHVREVLPEGFAQSFPATPDHTINLGGGQVVNNVDFGNFEYIIIPDGKDEVYGSAGADEILGDNEVGDPRTLSIGDDDTLFGEQGTDTLDGQDKNDDLWGGEAHDEIIGGVETDEEDRVLQEVDANQVLSDNLLTGQGNDNLVSIEHGTLIGGASINTLDARPFTRGSVILIGNANNDSLYGTVFDDELFGNAGNDLLDAGDGNDSLTGGEGSDNLMGGNGDETYIFTTAAAAQNDTVNEPALATAGLDVLDFTALGPTDPATVNLTTGTGGHTNRTLTFVNGQYIEVLLGGAGNDVFTGHAAANNRIEGNGGNDTLSGVGGANTIVGGAGNDTMTGGVNDDLYLFAAGFGTDTVTDPSGANDTLDLTAMTSAITGNIGAASASFAQGANSVNVTNNLVERILSGSGDDVFNFLAGGTLAAGAGSIDANDGVDHLNYSAYVTGVTVNLSTSTATGTSGVFDFENVTGGSAGDNITGNGDANVLSGLGGADSLFGQGGGDHLLGGTGSDPQLDGGAGNDTIEGGEGSDAMIGGLGDDLYLFAAPNVVSETDTVTEATSPVGGNDTFDFTFLTTALTANLPGNVVSHTLRTVNLANPTSIETILSGTGNDTLTGDGGDNLLVSGDGNDQLTSGGGDDVLIGGIGNDTYRIALNAVNDTVEVDERPGGGTDTLDFSVTTGGGSFVRVDLRPAGLDSVAGRIAKHGVDATRLVTTADDDLAINFENITGSGGSDVIFGSAVANSIVGGSGNDELHGGDGNDTLSGGLGGDTLFGEKHEDRLIGGQGTNVLDGGTHHDRYVFTQGSGATDTIREDPSQVSGGLTIIGGADILDFSAFTIPVTVNLSTPAAQTPATGLSLIMQRANASSNSDHFEVLLGSGTAANNLTGNLADNSLVGGSANDTLTGGAGDDTLTGNAGNDRLFGQADDDVLIYDSADVTTVDGGTGSDTLLFTAAGSLNLATATQLNDIDVIDLAGTASSVSGTPTAITNVSDAGTVIIRGGASANVSLTGGWTLFVNGSTTNTYQDLALTRFVIVEDDILQSASSPPAPEAVVVAARDRAVAAVGGEVREPLAARRVTREAVRQRDDAVDEALGADSGGTSQDGSNELRASRAMRRGAHRVRAIVDGLFGG